MSADKPADNNDSDELAKFRTCFRNPFTAPVIAPPSGLNVMLQPATRDPTRLLVVISVVQTTN
ncbi:hypothetical protein NITMOv2_3276 [Nitrospira moscoviensis]|uniref:Uncharacterized protein n=1 Tax=Nitrospira moscoviensis TaxID=42253 RepID=A0A0K2GFN7_NITMO|nr:hypothetical protein NITMOv2_3276 [Nitrospira moscoviensis]